jgi:hypothetical protein
MVILWSHWHHIIGVQLLDSGDEGWSLVSQRVPVYTSKELVCFDFTSTPLETQPLFEIRVEQFGDKVFARVTHWITVWCWEHQCVLEDVAEGIVYVFSSEWSATIDHFIEQNTKRPPIHCRGVESTTTYDLWRHVFWGANERLGQRGGLCGGELQALFYGLGSRDYTMLGQIEIRQHDVASVMHEHVLWLQISVNEPKHVQIFETREYLSSIEPGMGFHETLVGHPLQHVEEGTTGTVGHHKVQTLGTLETIVQGHDEGVMHSSQYFAFGQHSVKPIPFRYILFGEHFHSIQMIRPFLPHQIHSPNSTFA